MGRLPACHQLAAVNNPHLLPNLMIELTTKTIETQSILDSLRSEDCGATVLFLGTTRRLTDARLTETLTYTAYEEMARQQLSRLRDQALARWSIKRCVLVHRLGEVPVGEASVAVAVASPHRRDAFEAAQWLIDTLKQVVPVWKKEHWKDQAPQWVHPGLDSTAKKTL